MSADNGYLVHHCDFNPSHVGVFYYNASVGRPPDWYTFDNAEEVYSNEIDAVIAAHKLDQSNRTEYGVTVSNSVFAIINARLEGNRIK